MSGHIAALPDDGQESLSIHVHVRDDLERADQVVASHAASIAVELGRLGLHGKATAHAADGENTFDADIGDGLAPEYDAAGEEVPP